MISGFVHIKPIWSDNFVSVDKYPELRQCDKPMILTLGAITGTIATDSATVLLSRMVSTGGSLILYAGSFEIITLIGRATISVQITLNNDDTLSLDVTTKEIQ